MPIADGSLIKGISSPEVYVVGNAERHWIPDPETPVSQWSWANVQTLPDAEVTGLTRGDPIPSVVDPGVWPDNALSISSPAPEVYVMTGGQRHWVPDPQKLSAKGWDWSAVETIATSACRAGYVPVGSRRSRSTAEAGCLMGGE
jgi:hypothetical protein